MSSGAGWDARGDWFDPDDAAWIFDEWPTIADPQCTAWDVESMEWFPQHCQHCIAKEVA